MDRPNVLLIHTDQQRWDALGANGNDEIQTPNLDRLAGEGMNCRRSFVQAPVCMPSRASYMTGQYPSQLDIYQNGVTLPEDVETLPAMLSNYGYTTANVGKLHFLPHANRDHRERHPEYGFDHLEISDEPGPYADAYRAWVEKKDPDALDEVSVGLPPATEVWHDQMGREDGIEHPDERFPKRPVPFGADAGLTHSAFVAEQTETFVRDHVDDRFFCSAGFYSPHSPWVVPGRDLDRYDPAELSVPEFPEEWDARRDGERFTDEELRRARHGYYAMVSEVDRHVGRLLDTLETLGIAEETVVIFTSDHGENLGDHLCYGKGWPGRDPVSRVPFMIRWPETLDPGETDDFVELVDLVPTILDACGIQRPPHLEGESLLPVFRGERAGRDSALMESYEGKSLRTDGFRYGVEPDGSELLYDIDADPGEYHNVADDPDYEDALAAHRTELLRRVTELDIATQRPLDWSY
jgi:arylsulfatase A-like enzyme